MVYNLKGFERMPPRYGIAPVSHPLYRPGSVICLGGGVSTLQSPIDRVRRPALKIAPGAAGSNISVRRAKRRSAMGVPFTELCLYPSQPSRLADDRHCYNALGIIRTKMASGRFTLVGNRNRHWQKYSKIRAADGAGETATNSFRQVHRDSKAIRPGIDSCLLPPFSLTRGRRIPTRTPPRGTVEGQDWLNLNGAPCNFVSTAKSAASRIGWFDPPRRNGAEQIIVPFCWESLAAGGEADAAGHAIITPTRVFRNLA